MNPFLPIYDEDRMLERLIEEFMPLGIGGAETVSYTHLDVYKRQLSAWSLARH